MMDWLGKVASTGLIAYRIDEKWGIYGLQDIHRVVEGAVSTEFALEKMKEEERTAEVCCV